MKLKQFYLQQHKKKNNAGKNLKDLQDITENCRILLKEVEDSLHKRKDSPCS